MATHMHADHRRRLKEQFRSQGLDHFQPHNVLELLLFYAIPQKDVNPLAHQLVDYFGSLQAVFDAPYEELVKQPGMGEHSATLIKMIPDLSRYYLQYSGGDYIVDSVDSAWRYLAPRFVGRTEEVAMLLCLDAKGKVIKCPIVGSGMVNQTEINHRRILSEAINSNAVGVILAHNHPGGVALASVDDIRATEQINKLLTGVGIELLDHMIIGDGDCVSLLASGAFIK